MLISEIAQNKKEERRKSNDLEDAFEFKFVPFDLDATHLLTH